jgi:hypothetical protein
MKNMTDNAGYLHDNRLTMIHVIGTSKIMFSKSQDGNPTGMMGLRD